MASITDYVGASFGRFLISGHLGSGMEAETFDVHNRLTGRPYVLRLGVEQDALWAGEPKLPPENLVTERRGIEGSWRGTLAYERVDEGPTGLLWLAEKAIGLFNKNWTTGSTRVLIQVPVIFAVLDGEYLLPVSTPRRIRDALDIDVVVSSLSKADLLSQELWTDIIAVLSVDARNVCSGGLADSVFRERWDAIAGSPLVREHLQILLARSQVGASELAAITRLLGEVKPAEVAFEKNVVFALWFGAALGLWEAKCVRPTLSCPWFRENVTAVELQQVLAAFNGLRRGIGFESSILQMIGLMDPLMRQPLSTRLGGAEVETRQVQADFSRYSLFFQEHAGRTANYPVIPPIGG